MLAHLEDVKDVFENVRLFMVSIIVSELFTVAFAINRITLKCLFRTLCLVEIIYIGIIGGMLLVAKESMVLFVSLFHRLLFDNNGWILNDVTDRLVLLFPKDLYVEILIKFVYMICNHNN